MNTALSPPGASKSERMVLVVLFAGFVFTGIITVLVGPILPAFIARWSLDDAQAGLFFTTQFVGSLVGVLVSSALISWGYRPALLSGYFLMAAGIAGLNSQSRYFALAATAAYGCGYGFAVPATNLRVAETGGPRRASRLSLLNFTWGLGAAVCPLLVMVALKQNQVAAMLFAIAGFGFVITLALLGINAETHTSQVDGASGATTEPSVVQNSLLIAVILGLLFFIYVGTEVSVGGWAALHAKRLGANMSGGAALTPMFFWAALLTGRGLAPLALLKIKEMSLVTLGLALATIGITMIVCAKTYAFAATGVSIAGLGLSSVFPIYVAWLSKWYGEQARRLGGIMFALSSAGGSVLPWTVGYISKHANSLPVGLLVPLVSCPVMVALVALLRRRVSA